MVGWWCSSVLSLLSWRCQIGRRLLQPVRHAHLAVHRRRGGEVLVRLLPLAGALIQLAEAEVAVGDEGAHAELAGKCQRLIVAGVSRLHLRGFTMRGDLAEEIEDPRFDPPPSPLPSHPH